MVFLAFFLISIASFYLSLEERYDLAMGLVLVLT
jgi:hypothetical protein